MTLSMKRGDLEFCIKTMRTLSLRSRATRAQVACLIFHVPTRRIISMGYNGTPPGTSNIMEKAGKTLPEVIHAEMNALQKLSWYEKMFLLKHCILLVTHSPCVNCARNICNTKIPEIYYLDIYGNFSESYKLFMEHGKTMKRILER